MAPSLPVAADTPWPKPRTREGKTSAGTIKVVALGPKLKKNCRGKALADLLPALMAK